MNVKNLLSSLKKNKKTSPWHRLSKRLPAIKSPHSFHKKTKQQLRNLPLLKALVPAPRRRFTLPWRKKAVNRPTIILQRLKALTS